MVLDNNKIQELDLDLPQLIEKKKNYIISKFLKGYCNKQDILKSFECKIPGKLIDMPNLIFEKINQNEKAIEEIDHIYLLELDGNENQIEIEDFDFYYYADYYHIPKNEKILHEGKKLKLENDNLYFLEIRKSLTELNLTYEKLKDTKIIESKNIENTEATKYKIEDLTDIGNTLLTVSIFSKLINKILNRKTIINILYIIDDIFNLDVFNIFKKCLSHDKKMIENIFQFKLYLIFIKPSFKNNNENFKNNEIELLIDDNIKLQKKIDDKNAKIPKISVDKEIIEFCQKINSDKTLITVGILEEMNKKHKYMLSSLESVQNLLESNLKENYYLIDFKTFNQIKFEEMKDENLCDNYLSDYKNKIKLCECFDEEYLLVDIFFLNNLENIFTETIVKYYAIKIYMFENPIFMIHLKRDINIIKPEIKFMKNSCKNPMLEDSQDVNLKEAEEFALNYYNLLSLKNFFANKQI